MFTSILVPTDFSAPSDAALDYARRLAATFGASLHVLHVIEAPFTAGPLGTGGALAEAPVLYPELFELARAALARRVSAADRARLTATTEIVAGKSASCIVERAIERDVDLIVMGTHGRRGMAHLLMGSVAEKVVRAAPCPVMTVRGSATTGSLLAAQAVHEVRS
jgi:nucleotide-binding universal stress UspA family protein